MNSSRRVFLRNTTFSLAAGALYGRESPKRFRYVAVPDAIHVSRRDGSGWTTVQRVPSRSPRALTWHGNRRFLYVANEIDDHDGLPRGTVEAYSADPNTGYLSLLNREPLSLSATRPRSLAVSPDHQHLVAAAYGGGSYNVLRIEPDGGLGCVSGILKEAGSSAHPEHQTSAHPHTLLFDKSGRYLLSTDLGCDRINVFRLTSSGALVRHCRFSVAPGSGPGSLALDNSGTVLYVRNELRDTVCRYSFDPRVGQILEPLV